MQVNKDKGAAKWRTYAYGFTLTNGLAATLPPQALRPLTERAALR